MQKETVFQCNCPSLHSCFDYAYSHALLIVYTFADHRCYSPQMVSIELSIFLAFKHDFYLYVYIPVHITYMISMNTVHIYNVYMQPISLYKYYIISYRIRTVLMHRKTCNLHIISLSIYIYVCKKYVIYIYI